MPARLSPLNQPNAAAISLQRPVQLVGRHHECDVRIDQRAISRRHCCIALVYEKIVIRDLGSRNGVRVNGEIVEEAVLQDGDQVAIGPLIFAVEAPEAVKPPITPNISAPLPNFGANSNSNSDNDLIPLDL